MEYTELGSDEQYRLLQGRLLNAERQHFTAANDLVIAEGISDEDGIEKNKALMAKLEVAADLTRSALEALPEPEPVPTRGEVNRARAEAIKARAREGR